MLALYKKEIKSFFSSPMAYGVIAIFTFFSGILFFFNVIALHTSSTEGFFTSLLLVVIFIIAIMSMKFFSEENKNKTDQLLLTSPVSLVSIVLAKFLAGVTVFLVGTAITLLYMITIVAKGEPEVGVIVFSYLGVILMASALISIGVFISSLTKSQLISAAVSLMVFLFLYLFSGIASYIIEQISGVFPSIRSFVSSFFAIFIFFSKYIDMTGGILDIGGIIYYLSIIAIFVFLTVMTLEKRRWS